MPDKLNNMAAALKTLPNNHGFELLFKLSNSNIFLKKESKCFELEIS